MMKNVLEYGRNWRKFNGYVVRVAIEKYPVEYGRNWRKFNGYVIRVAVKKCPYINKPPLFPSVAHISNVLGGVHICYVD